jgi:nucleoside-diphosphate-sugar epimerase
MSSNGDPVFVTGASGFIGSCAVRELLYRGYSVHLLLRDPSRSWRLSDLLDYCVVHEGDLRDANELSRIVRGIVPEAVVHAATMGAYEFQGDMSKILETNILGTANLLQACNGLPLRAFVNIGSTSEYGFASKPMQEEDRLEPNSYYAVAKAAQTHLATHWSRKEDQPLATFRLFSTYGPYEEPTRLMPTILRRIRLGQPLELVSPFTARDFIYIDDVLDALLNFDAVEQSRGEIYNVASGEEYHLSEVVEVAQQIIGNRVELRWGSMQPRQWDSSRWQGDIEKIRKHLGWEPKYDLYQGLSKMDAWIRDEFERTGLGARAS